MKNNTSKIILAFIEKNGRATPKELIDHLGITKQAVFRHLAKLIENNNVLKNGKPPKVFYFLNSNNQVDNQNWLIKKQSLLQKQARDVLNNLGLINELSKFGQASIAGSVALGLMTWSDIDIDLESSVEINERDYFEIIKYIFNQKNVKHLALIDNRSAFEKNRPRSMYIGITYVMDGVDWKIDIRYLNPIDASAKNNTDQIKAKLSPEKIKTIFEIKTAFHNHPEYGKEFSGYDIYNAVLNKNISTVEEFSKYLKEKK